MTITISTELPSIDELPKNFLIELNDFDAISLSGEEQGSYLQGQVTCDVFNCTENKLMVGAHCDAKGKVFSVFRLFNRHGKHLLLQPKSCIENSLTALNKFAVFSKVDIKKVDNLHYLALVGDQAPQLLAQHFSQIPDSHNPVVQIGSTSLIFLPAQHNRYIIIDSVINIQSLQVSLALPTYTHAVWNLLEITAGFPLLSDSTSGHYVPQMLNLQVIDGISFTKGCYMGQETVARMQYLGKNKRALYSLESRRTDIIQTDDILEKQLGEHWRKAGDILAYYQADNGHCAIQAILVNEEELPRLRLSSQSNLIISFKTLPYSLSPST
jgi:hypothetical protein